MEQEDMASTLEHNEGKRVFFQIEENNLTLKNASFDEIDALLDREYPVNMFRYENIREKLEVGQCYSGAIRTADDLYCLPNFRIYYIKRIK